MAAAASESRWARTEALSLFGERVKQARLKRGLSQVALAERASLDRSYISGIERGRRNVSLWNILQLAEALEVRASDLLDEVV
jgi:transcriptional regulator with XRE-family HTH domain